MLLTNSTTRNPQHYPCVRSSEVSSQRSNAVTSCMDQAVPLENNRVVVYFPKRSLASLYEYMYSVFTCLSMIWNKDICTSIFHCQFKNTYFKPVNNYKRPRYLFFFTVRGAVSRDLDELQVVSVDRSFACTVG
jgi:hypothetical protein